MIDFLKSYLVSNNDGLSDQTIAVIVVLIKRELNTITVTFFKEHVGVYEICVNAGGGKKALGTFFFYF